MACLVYMSLISSNMTLLYLLEGKLTPLMFNLTKGCPKAEINMNEIHWHTMCWQRASGNLGADWNYNIN